MLQSVSLIIILHIYWLYMGIYGRLNHNLYMMHDNIIHKYSLVMETKLLSRLFQWHVIVCLSVTAPLFHLIV